MKGRCIPYSADELAFIQSVSTRPRAEAHVAFCQKFGRDDVSLQNLHALCKRKGWMTGRTGQIEAGAVPYNKGLRCGPGQGGNHPNARRTQFQGGVRLGVAERLYKPIGTERVSKDGYLERKIHDGMPLQSRWRAVHLIIWEEANGPIPAGMALKCLNGDRRDTSPANWEAVPRALLPRLAGGRHKTTVPYDTAHPDLRPAILAAAKLEHRARQARSAAKPAESPNDR